MAESSGREAASYDYQRILSEATAEVQKTLGENDASHDFAHIERVRKVALRLAKDEGVEDAQMLHVIELGALLHDIADFKYSGSDEASGIAAQAILQHAAAPDWLVERVLRIIGGVGFSTELNAGAGELPLEVKIVQDADRLDAIGAIGIARCFTFGGAKKRVLHDPSVAPLKPEEMTKEAYRDPSRVHTTINHFCEWASGTAMLNVVE